MNAGEMFEDDHAVINNFPENCYIFCHLEIFLICTLGKHFRQNAHAIRFLIGLHGTEKFHPIFKSPVEREPV